MFFVQLSTPFVRLGDLIPTVKERRDLDRQNRELRTENELLRQQARALELTGSENLRLQQLLAFKQRNNLRALGARVIGRDISHWFRSIQIDRGSNDGLRPNLTVVTAAGVIGKTITVTPGESRVLLLTDPNCKTSALLEGSRAHGILVGATGPNLLMTYIPPGTAIKAGETVITSGLGGVFPKGLLLGTVLRTRFNPETGMYLDAELIPSADFQRIEEVLVITE